MVSAWDVYWVMQLNGLILALGIGGGISASISLIALVVNASRISGANIQLAKYGEREKQHPGGYVEYIAESRAELDDARVWIRPAKRVLAGSVAALMLAALLPSSQTAAAMILVPKLTSPEVLQPVGAEAKELYQLAKGALRKLAQARPAQHDK